jgi:CspA family cold shock protein
MTHYGKIKSYDSSKGVGTIAPETGGEPLAFDKADLQQEAQMPKVDQRYGYETSQVDGGMIRAIDLQMEQGRRAQADRQQG